MTGTAQRIRSIRRVAFRHFVRAGLRATLTQAVWVVFLCWITMLPLAVRKGAAPDFIVGVIVASSCYVAAYVAARAAGVGMDLLGQCMVSLPVVPARVLLRAIAAHAVALLFLPLLPLGVIYGFGHGLPVPFGWIIADTLLGYATVVCLVLNRAVRPAPWDLPLFALRFLFRAYSGLWNRSGRAALLLTVIGGLLLWKPGIPLAAFLDTPPGGNPLAEAAYFLVNPVGSLIRMRTGGGPVWVVAAMQAILALSCVAALVSLVTTLRLPAADMEAEEFDAFRAGRPGTTWLGHAGLMAAMRCDDPSGGEEGEDGSAHGEDDAPAITLDELERLYDAIPYMENAPPEQVAAAHHPWRVGISGIAVPVVGVLVLFIVWLAQSFDPDTVRLILGCMALAWGAAIIIAFPTPGPEACWTPCHWPRFVAHAFRAAAWRPVALAVGIAAAATLVMGRPWWWMSAWLAYFALAHACGFCLQWLACHERTLNRGVGVVTVLPLVAMAAAGYIASLAASVHFSITADTLLVWALRLLTPYLLLVLVPCALWQAWRRRWQVNAPPMPTSGSGGD